MRRDADVARIGSYPFGRFVLEDCSGSFLLQVSDNILEAIAALKTALKLKPDCPLAYFVLTRCLQVGI